MTKDRIDGELSTRDKRKINKMRERVDLLNEELERYRGEEKKLNFKMTKLEKDRRLLLKKIEEKDSEIEELSQTKRGYHEKLVENEGTMKKILARLTFKTEGLEDENEGARRSIKEVERKVEKIDHFLEKNRKKEERLGKEIEEMTIKTSELSEKQSRVEKDLAVSESSLKEYTPA